MFEHKLHISEPGPMTSKEAHPEAKKLPNNLYEALSAMKTSDFVMKCLGPDIVDGFVLLKMQEWNLYVSQITKWEKEFYLDCWFDLHNTFIFSLTNLKNCSYQK